jgi:hypothetical protein
VPLFWLKGVHICHKWLNSLRITLLYTTRHFYSLLSQFCLTLVSNIAPKSAYLLNGKLSFFCIQSVFFVLLCLVVQCYIQQCSKLLFNPNIGSIEILLAPHCNYLEMKQPIKCNCVLWAWTCQRQCAGIFSKFWITNLNQLWKCS